MVALCLGNCVRFRALQRACCSWCWRGLEEWWQKEGGARTLKSPNHFPSNMVQLNQKVELYRQCCSCSIPRYHLMHKDWSIMLLSIIIGLGIFGHVFPATTQSSNRNTFSPMWRYWAGMVFLEKQWQLGDCTRQWTGDRELFLPACIGASVIPAKLALRCWMYL